MHIYPAIKARMGDWSYYIVRMKMREIAREIEFAGDIYEDRTLGDAIQRALDEGRVKRSIVSYLAKRPDRFFSSLVVAAVGGEPSWYAVEMAEDLVPPVFARSKQLADSFGILSFDEDPKYYALDGQHRLKAIKMLIEGSTDMAVPHGFVDEQVSVLVVLRGDAEDEKEWLQRYRRLFSSLNRYAKPTDRDTNIIMDEDDVFAILTRRLITEHDQFRAPGHEKESFRVQTKGKNLRQGTSHFISLQSLYALNVELLHTPERRHAGWGPDEERLKAFIGFRPDEEVIDSMYEELLHYWNGLLAAVPDLAEDPAKMRCHELPEHNDQGLRDHLAFWTIGQEVFGQLVRDCLDAWLVNAGLEVSEDSVKSALEPLGRMKLDLHEIPWRGLLLVGPFEEGAAWRMRSEDRSSAVEVSLRVARWLLGVAELEEEEIQELEQDWRHLQYPPLSSSDAAKVWAHISNERERLAS